MSWGAKTSLGASLTSISGTQQYFANAVTLNPGESVLVEVECDFQTTPTEGLQVYIFPTLDDTAESWDEVPYISALIPHSGLPGGTADPAKISIQVSGLYKFRVGVKTGGTDTHTSATAYYMKDGVSA
jgi:hypothetical protein